MGSDMGSDMDCQEPAGPFERAILDNDMADFVCATLMMKLTIDGLDCTADFSILNRTAIPPGIASVEQTCPCSCMDRDPMPTEPTIDTSEPPVDVCDKLIPLLGLSGQMEGDTRDAGDDYTLSCGGR